MNDTSADQSQAISSGVQALIDRLRDEGVSAGREQAGRIAKQAEKEAHEIVAKARRDADTILADARREVEQTQRAGEDALRLAMRDTVLQLKAFLSEQMSEKVNRLLGKEMDQQDFLRKMILELVGNARVTAGIDKGATAKVILPREFVDIEELRRNPLELREGSLSHFVLHTAQDLLREGITFGASDDDSKGIRLYLEDKEVQIDCTDERIATLILAHLQPRFRAILEGTVK